MRHIVLLTMLACAGALAGPIGAFADDPASPTPSSDAASGQEAKLTHTQVQQKIDRYRHRTWHWQRVMGRPVTLTLEHPPANPEQRIETWRRIAARTRYVALHPPHLQAWSCIHHYEGAWNDPNAPYYGGLQMDLSFQRAYGRHLLVRKGTANRWTPLEQMWVAERALRAGRGYHPWPNTARYCGLI
jgi:hypothetical protein